MAVSPLGSDTPAAQEAWCLVRRRFTASHRALWHLAHLRRNVVVRHRHSLGDANTEAEGVSVVYARGEKTLLVPLAASPAGQDWRITPRTQVSFIAQRYHFIFSVDVSPSVSVVDTSFKGFSTGTYLLDSMQPCLEDTLRLLLQSMSINGEAFEPEFFLTVLIQGHVGSRMSVAVHARRVTKENMLDVLRTVEDKLMEVVSQQSAGLQAAQEVTAQQTNPSAAAKHSEGAERYIWDDVCKHNDLSVILRNCLLALSMSAVPDATPAVVVFTDGILWSYSHTMCFDGMLMHLNALDVALHIIQIGGGFAPWSALGMCSDVDLLQFVVSSSPGGELLQDHHISHMLHESPAGSDTVVNRLQRSWLLRATALSASSLDANAKKAYSARSYLSSLAEPHSDKEAREDADEQSYIAHLKLLGCKYPPKKPLPNLDEATT